MSKVDNTLEIIIGLVVIVVLLVIMAGNKHTKENIELIRVEEVVRTYKVYHATAPFGYLYKDLHGRGGDGFLYYYWRFDNDLEEVIIINYLDGNELKTIKSTDVFTFIKIVVDGEFYLESLQHYREKWVYDKLVEKQPLRGLTYALHIPSLPTPDYNATSDYIVIS